jgi:hypothetical protein
LVITNKRFAAQIVAFLVITSHFRDKVHSVS